MKIFYKSLVLLIKCILWCIDKDHREIHEIENDNTKKFTHVEDCNFNSDFGTVSKAVRTIPYDVWELSTDNFTITAADKHRVIDENHNCVWIEDLKIGDKIKTQNGIEKVKSVRNLGIKTHMYCIEVNTEDKNDEMNHLYYGNGILSHNTTCAGAFILWECLFAPKDKKRDILIAAHKFTGATEIISRIKEMYWSVPYWFRDDNDDPIATEIRFANGSKIQVTTTTSDTGRGKSLWRLYCDEFAFVDKNIAEDFWSGIASTLSTGGKCVITSTPNSDADLFAKMVKDAQNIFDEHGNPNPSGLGKNGFFLCKAIWADHPDRDEKWYENMYAKLGPEKFAREHECVDGDTTLVTIRKDGVIQQVTVSELYRMQLDN